MKYQTKMYCGAFPPCQTKCVAGTCDNKKAAPPNRTARRGSAIRKPRHMSTNWTLSAFTTERIPPRKEYAVEQNVPTRIAGSRFQTKIIWIRMSSMSTYGAGEE